jgi:hypothetical protein
MITHPPSLPPFLPPSSTSSFPPFPPSLLHILFPSLPSFPRIRVSAGEQAKREALKIEQDLEKAHRQIKFLMGEEEVGREGGREGGRE